MSFTAEDLDQATNTQLYKLLQEIRDAIQMAVDYDPATNARRITGAVTVSSGTITTVTTAATLTNQTNIGGKPADMMTDNMSMLAYSSIRNLLT